MTTNIISVENLIKDKVKIEQSDDKVINCSLLVPRLGGEIELAFTKNDVRDFLDVTNTPGVTNEQAGEAGENLIYTIIANPNLKDETLQKTYECQVPSDIVHKIFNDGEMLDIANFATKKAGFKSGSVIEVGDLKNS